MITQSELFEFIAHDQELDIVDLSLETQLDSLGIDSLAKLELVFHLEDYFHITIPNNNISVNTVQDVLDLANKYTP
jgi:acyl carrier protein